MEEMKIRVGIDVGGTFTKAVGVNVKTMELCGVAITPTTHDAKEGVAKGVVYVFNKLLEESGIKPEDVIFIAHSTTQATNALLEGDVASVGIVGMGAGSLEAQSAKKQTVIDNVEVAPGKYIPVFHTSYDTAKGVSDEEANAIVNDLKAKGAETIVAAEAFGVDDPTNELAIMKAAANVGVPATGSHEISQLYGLKIRTRTAVINASILVKMIETAEMTEKSVRSSGTEAPLMVMRGDGGVMSIAEMRRRPILTALSGPAASVAGVLFYLKVSNGIYFEVGGTSTNIGVIKNGRPMVKHVEIGGHSTYLHSLDVRVLGIAGGSIPRIKNGKIIDVGPRSAHIAGLPYAAFADPEELKGCEMVYLSLKADDPTDYVGVRTKSGKMYAVTNTCAGNAIGIIKEGDYSYGNPESARLAFEPIAKALNMTVDEAADKVLDVASQKAIHVVEALIKEYNLDTEASVLIGAGGGVAPIIRYVSQKMNIRHEIPQNAEVISSIGDALAMVRETIEKSITNPTPEDIIRIRKECENHAIASGAAPGSVEVFIEVDSVKNRVLATAVGSTEFVTNEASVANVSEEQIVANVAESMHADVNDVTKIDATSYLGVYSAPVYKKTLFGKMKVVRKPIRVADHNGVIRLACANGISVATTVAEAIETLETYSAKYSQYIEGAVLLPETYMLYESRVFDMTGLGTLPEQTTMVDVELQQVAPETPVVFVFGVK